MKNAFTSKINDYPIPKSLQKPLNVRLYDETKYPNDHINAALVKFKVFCFDIVGMTYDMV